MKPVLAQSRKGALRLPRRICAMKAGLFISLIYFSGKNYDQKHLFGAGLVDNQLWWLRGLMRADARLCGYKAGSADGGHMPLKQQAGTGNGVPETKPSFWG